MVKAKDIASKMAGMATSNKMKAMGLKYMANPYLRMAGNSGLAFGAGVIGAGFDKEDDGVASTIGKGIKSAALETFVEEGIVMAIQSQLATKGIPDSVLGGKLATKMLGSKAKALRGTSLLNLPEEQQKALHANINKFVKSQVHLPKGKFMAAGVGAAAGLAVSAFNGDADGVLGTAGNMAVGAGLGLIGKEAYEHFAPKEEKTAASYINKFYKNLADGGYDVITDEMTEETFNKWKTKTGFEEANLRFKNPLKEGIHFSGSSDGTIHAQRGPIATAGMQYLRHTNDPIFQDAQKIFGENPTNRQMLDFVMGHEFGHLDHFRQGIEFEDDNLTHNSNGDREKYKTSGREKHADEFARRHLAGESVPESPIEKSIQDTIKRANRDKSFIHAQIDDFAKQHPLVVDHVDALKGHATGYIDSFYDKTIRTARNINVPISEEHFALNELRTNAYSEVMAQEMHKIAGIEFDPSKHTLKVSDVVEQQLADDAVAPKGEVTVQDVAKVKTEVDAKKSFDKLAESKKIKNNLSKMKVAGVIGLTAFAAASILDTNKENQQDVRASRMKGEQDRNLKHKASEEQKTMSQFQLGGPTDFGSIVTEMWDQRIGHHLMGNAKFQR